MDKDARRSDSLVATATRIGRSLLGLLKARLELLSVELQEEKIRALDLLAWITIAIALAVATILLAIGTLAWFLWRQAGYAGLLGLTAASGASAVVVFLGLRRRLTRGPLPFASTAEEFRKDLEWLRRDN